MGFSYPSLLKKGTPTNPLTGIKRKLSITLKKTLQPPYL